MVLHDGAHPDILPPIVLLVLSDAEVAQTYQRAFEASGLWVDTASPVEAVAVAVELRPDLIVTDVFPEAGGSMLESFKSSEFTGSIPVILLSSPPLRAVPIETRRLADVCLQQPVPAAALIAESQAVIARSRERTGSAAVAPARVRRPEPAHASSPRLGKPRQPAARNCPDCGTPLEWSERSRLLGTEYDYYRWCAKGCGLHCYDLENGTWVKLA